ncbi:MAG: alkaline phosphatase family protein [Nocardioides sp.]
MIVSIDGLNPRALAVLGESATPTLHRLIAEGASTLNARSLRESTETLPNHVGMVTGLRVAQRRGGHGVAFNVDNGSTIATAAGRRVASIFSRVSGAGGAPALFASKDKFRFIQRSWRNKISRFTMRESNGKLTQAFIRDLAHQRQLRFVHLSAPDKAGHAHGFMSAAYLKGVRRSDARLGSMIAALEAQGSMDQTLVIVTADHGGRGARHYNPRKRPNYTVPLIFWGAGVTVGDLYELNPERHESVSRGTYGELRPIFNADVANAALTALSLKLLPGGVSDGMPVLRLVEPVTTTIERN